MAHPAVIIEAAATRLAAMRGADAADADALARARAEVAAWLARHDVALAVMLALFEHGADACVT